MEEVTRAWLVLAAAVVVVVAGTAEILVAATGVSTPMSVPAFVVSKLITLLADSHFPCQVGSGSAEMVASKW